MKSIHVTDHAINQFRQRADRPYRYGEALDRIQELWCSTSPAELDPRYRLGQLLRHGADHEAEYRMGAGWVMVMVRGVIVTVHRNESGRWRRLQQRATA